MRTRILLPAALAAAISVSPAAAQTAGEARLTVAQSEKYGAYLADGEKRTLYMFTADKQGKEGAEAESSCYDACAKAWPPLLAQDMPELGGELEKSLVGTIERKDGKMQVTYGGWPLYYFVKDKEPGSVAGQDVHGFDGEWYLVSPDGSKNEKGG